MSNENPAAGSRKRLSNVRAGKTGENGSARPAPPTDPYASDYDFLLVNGDIDEALFGQVVQAVSSFRANNKVVVCIVTRGGGANAAYRIGRYLQHAYSEVVAFVPTLCKSAGTLIVTAANKLVMSDYGEVGPLDVQLSQRDEIIGNRSGLVTRSAIEDLRTQTFELFEKFAIGITVRSQGAVTFRLAAEIAAKTAAECMASIYEKISPDALGQDLRDLNVATEYARRLSKNGQNLKSNAIQKLVHDYPSHDFVIDFDEAATLFHHVEKPTATLTQLILDNLTEMMSPLSDRSSVRMLVSQMQDTHDSSLADGDDRSGRADDTRKSDAENS